MEHNIMLHNKKWWKILRKYWWILDQKKGKYFTKINKNMLYDTHTLRYQKTWETHIYSSPFGVAVSVTHGWTGRSMTGVGNQRYHRSAWVYRRCSLTRWQPRVSGGVINHTRLLTSWTRVITTGYPDGREWAYSGARLPYHVILGVTRWHRAYRCWREIRKLWRVPTSRNHTRPRVNTSSVGT